MPHGVTIAGTPGPIRIGEEVARSNIRPIQHRVFWRGERTSVYAGFNSIANKATEAVYRQDGASATIEALYREDETYTDIVEICFNTVQREWWTMPANVTFTGEQRAMIMAFLRELEQFAEDGATAAEIAALYGDIVSQLEVIAADLAHAFEDIFYNGDSYMALLPVITWTRVVSPIFSTPYVIEDMGKVFSTGSLLGALNNAGIATGTIEFTIADVINTIAANEKQTLGWLKTGRKVDSSDGGSHYVQEFIFDAYRTRGYTFV